jgi:hypothetical protein
MPILDLRSTGKWAPNSPQKISSKKEKFNQTGLVQGNPEGGSSTAPARVSPASAAEQEQHYENNQYGFHLVTSFVKRSSTGFVTTVSLPHYSTS